MIPGVGSQVAGYRIDGLVGRGGGGVVYRATHRHLGRTDALKLLAPELATDREFQRRFEREAKMAGALDHPHIIPVYDAGEADGVLYLAMRLVEGPDLATMIETTGWLDPRLTCAILSQVASALDAAHAKGLVHRDVKPGNILVDHVADAGRAEHAYLSDFGLTRQFVGSALSGTTAAGTPWYMAPERFRGVPSAPAIDVYALGCVAYACLVGSPPFNGDSFESVMAAHLYEPPPRIGDHRADLPAGVDAVLAKAIAKAPTDRYPTCGAFATALHDEIHAGVVPPPVTWKSPVPAARAPLHPMAAKATVDPPNHQPPQDRWNRRGRRCSRRAGGARGAEVWHAGGARRIFGDGYPVDRDGRCVRHRPGGRRVSRHGRRSPHRQGEAVGDDEHDRRHRHEGLVRGRRPGHEGPAVEPAGARIGRCSQSLHRRHLQPSDPKDRLSRHDHDDCG